MCLNVCNLKNKKERKLKYPYEINHKFISGIEFKLCSDCEDWHPLNSEWFYKNNTSPDGFNPYCKESTKLRSSKWVDGNRERHNKNQLKYFKTEKGKAAQHKELATWRKNGGQKKYFQKNKEKLIEYAKNKKLNGTHDITDEEWFACLDYFNQSCAYCGLSEADQFNHYNHQFHREHVIPSGSNYIDNCVPACTKCNVSKHDTEFNDWYNESNKTFSKRRYNKIVNWMTKECFKVLNLQ